MKLMDKTMRLFGYENINNIKVPKWYKKPATWKMRFYESYFRATNNFHSRIILDNKNRLKDGYTSYLIAKTYGIEYVKVEHIKFARKNGKTTMITERIKNEVQNYDL